MARTSQSPKDRSSKPAPQQERSRQTLKRVLTATEQLLAEQTLEQITVRQILKRAGVSTGSFYARFAGKEELIQTIWDEMKLTVDDFLDGLDREQPRSLVERVRMLMEHRIARYYKYRGLFRAFISQARLGKPPFAPKDRKEYMQSQRDLVGFLMASSDEITHPEPEQAIIMAEFATAATARELILFPTHPHSSTVKLSRAKLTDHLTNIFYAFLTSGKSGCGDPLIH